MAIKSGMTFEAKSRQSILHAVKWGRIGEVSQFYDLVCLYVRNKYETHLAIIKTLVLISFMC